MCIIDQQWNIILMNNFCKPFYIKYISEIVWRCNIYCSNPDLSSILVDYFFDIIIQLFRCQFTLTKRIIFPFWIHPLNIKTKKHICIYKRFMRIPRCKNYRPLFARFNRNILIICTHSITFMPSLHSKKTHSFDHLR